MCIFDNGFMNMVFKDEDCIREVLEAALDQTVEIAESITERTIANLCEKDVRLDLLVRDVNDDYYNLEIQRDNGEAIILRARYYCSTVDVEISFKGEEYKDKKRITVIFLCEGDPLGCKTQKCIIERRRDSDNAIVDDREKIIYLNAKHKDLSTRLGRVLFNCGYQDVEKMYDGALKRRVMELKNNPSEEEMKMMSEAIDNYARELAKDERDIGKREGKLEGKQESKIEIALNLIKLKISFEDISSATGLTIKEINSLI